ncbi:MAG: 50S ribosomal protein L6 [Deltaproteobacteria bacterium]|nr:50S ribosomal protein L6 [Deltaproteobacteria bacterium]
MSRIGKKPVPIPEKVEVKLDGRNITIKGAKGVLCRTFHPDVNIAIDDGQVIVSIAKKDKKTNALWGTTRAHIANMIQGVSAGFERVLEINGIGYKAELKGDSIEFNLGYSHSINFKLPEGVSAVIEKPGVKLLGIDKEKLGFAASTIRAFRPPEPYKGKGIKYAEEYVARKAGKTAK